MAAYHDLQFGFEFEAPEDLSISDSQPLITPQYFELDTSQNAPNVETSDWSDSDILLFVENYLHASLALLGSGYAGNAARKEVTAWLMDEGTDNPLSFNNCCAMLGFDNEELRSHTLRVLRHTTKRDR